MKELVAEAIARRVQDGDVIGVGTGSTVEAALAAIERRARAEKLSLTVLTTSYQSAMTCGRIGMTVLDPLSYEGEIRWGFDGADEVDPRLRLIKGKGAAQLREKVLAARCREFVVIVDESKLVQMLGEKMPIPVEVFPEAISYVHKRLIECGATEIMLRSGLPGKHGPVLTEGGNFVLDVRFKEIRDDMERELKSIVGVVETGLFFGYATEVLVGGVGGLRTMRLS